MSDSIRYRADIDGLRAIAVLGVIVYHARLGVLSGGYTGVDIFFVISGYLISSIILREHAHGTFSIARFYERRIRRIFPALMMVIATTAVVGWFILSPYDYQVFGQSALAASAFFSNFFFNRFTDYFAPASETHPLLHTWSLGVEEQFYLLAPFALLLIMRLRRPYKSIVVMGLLVLSLAISMYGIEYEWPSAFYLLPSRAFEILIGVAVALRIYPVMHTQVTRTLVGLAGLAAIAIAMLTYRPETPFPGVAALLPCLGTAALIASGERRDTPTCELLSFGPLVLIGTISYSLYLWHWPVLSMAHYAIPEDPDLLLRFLLLALSVILATLSWAFIEVPMREGVIGVHANKVFVGALASIVLCWAGSAMLDTTHGATGRLSPERLALLKSIPNAIDQTNVCPLHDAAEKAHCHIGSKTAQPSFVLFGDSHALAIAGEVARDAQEMGKSGYLVFAHGCPPMFALEAFDARKFRMCVDAGNTLARVLEEPNIRTILVVGRWAVWSEGARMPNETRNPLRMFAEGDHELNRKIFSLLLQASVETWTRNDRRVVIFGPVPELPFDLRNALQRDLMFGTERDRRVPVAEFKRRQTHVLDTLAGLATAHNVTVFYPHKLICSDVDCATLSREGRPLYVDEDHLSRDGAALMREQIISALKLASGASADPGG